jgi:hypothetical protein
VASGTWADSVATFDPETDYFGSRDQQTMINFRVSLSMNEDD